MQSCKQRHADIAKLLLGRPDVDVKVATVSLVAVSFVATFPVTETHCVFALAFHCTIVSCDSSFDGIKKLRQLSHAASHSSQAGQSCDCTSCKSTAARHAVTQALDYSLLPPAPAPRQARAIGG